METVPRRSAVRLVAAAVVALTCLAIATARPALAEDRYRGRPLVEVLRELRERGLELIFSSAVVDRNLLVTVEPGASEPSDVLDEILRPLGLKAEPGPGGAILILPAGEETGVLRGSVLSLARGHPVAGATVLLLSSDHAGISGADGAFEIRHVPPGRYEVLVQASGYSPARLSRVRVRSEGDTASQAELTIRLVARPSFVTEVVVTPNTHSVVQDEQAATRSITGDEIIVAPAVGGDISRVIELLPGVTVPDNTAALNVRGSVARDLSMILDGLELYDPFHLQGFQSPFSLIGGNVVDRVDFFGGGFTADLGDRHGGFVDISTPTAETPARREFELGSVNSRLSYQSPASTSAGAWLVSARAWYPEAVRPTTQLGAGEEIDPRFGDVYAKGVFHVRDRHQLSGHALFSYDRMRYRERGETVNESADALTRTGYLWFRALDAWSSRATSETVVSGGRIERVRDGFSAEDEGIDVDDNRTVAFFGVKHDSTVELSAAQALKLGVEARWLDARYRYSNTTLDPPESEITGLSPEGLSTAVYAAHRVRVSSRLATELGLRWDRQSYTDDNQLSPRFNLAWWPRERWEARLALGRFTQSQRIHELQIEDGETTFQRAEIADQAELSLQHLFPRGIRIRFDAYYRELSDLRARYENLFEPVELFPETTPDRIRIAPTEARLQGAELLLQGDGSRPLVWWVSYVLSAAEDRIDGDWQPRSWDQTHAGRFLVGYRGDPRWSVSLIGSAHTGWPTTPIFAELDDAGEVEETLGERNSDRLRRYVRFDLRARTSFDVSRGRVSLTLEVLNLTDQENECCLNEVFTFVQPDDSVTVVRDFDHWLGITPTFSVLWEF